MNIEKFCSTYESVVKRNANRLKSNGNIGYEDLYQEGMLSLVIVFNEHKLSNIQPDRHIKYITVMIRGAMLKLISSMKGAVGVDHNKFYDKDFIAHTFSDVTHEVDVTTIPQDVAMIIKEEEAVLVKAVRKVLPTLSYGERFVWDNIIATDNPMTTTMAADYLAYRSKGSITNLKIRIIDKIKKEVE